MNKKRVACNRVKTSFVVFFPVCSAVKMESDLFDLQSTFQPGSTGLPVATAWAGKEPPPPPSPTSPTKHLCFWTLHALLLLLLTLMPTSSSPLFFFFFFLSFSLSLSLFPLPAQILSPLLKLEMIPCQTLTLSSQKSLSMPLTYLSCLQTVLAFPLGHLVMKCLVVTTHFVSPCRSCSFLCSHLRAWSVLHVYRAAVVFNVDLCKCLNSFLCFSAMQFIPSSNCVIFLFFLKRTPLYLSTRTFHAPLQSPYTHFCFPVTFHHLFYWTAWCLIVIQTCRTALS